MAEPLMPFIPGPYSGQPIAMMSCWRCGINKVEEDDSLGCCPSCIEMLRDPDYVSPGWANAVIIQVERERNEQIEREMRESG